MAAHCQKCGAEIPDGSPVCRSCFEPVKREGIFVRLARFFSGKSTGGGTKPLFGGIKVAVRTTERIRMRDPVTGEMHEYHSLEEMPTELREKLRKMEEEMGRGEGGTSGVRVTGHDGKTQIYRSVEELPPDLRALYEKSRGESS